MHRPDVSTTHSPICTTVIRGFHQDATGDWVAELACGHAQHVRHLPPWQSRPWVGDAAGRAEKLGAAIACPLCEMPRAPANLVEYKRSATFTQSSIPAGLLRSHSTKFGVWARIVIESGQLDYTFDSPLRTFVLTPEFPGIIPHEVPHSVTAGHPVTFHLEFLRVPGD